MIPANDIRAGMIVYHYADIDRLPCIVVAVSDTRPGLVVIDRPSLGVIQVESIDLLRHTTNAVR